MINKKTKLVQIRKKLLNTALAFLLAVTLGVPFGGSSAFADGNDRPVQSVAVDDNQNEEGTLEEALNNKELLSEEDSLEKAAIETEEDPLTIGETKEDEVRENDAPENDAPENNTAEEAKAKAKEVNSSKEVVSTESVEPEEKGLEEKKATALDTGAPALKADISSQLSNLTWNMYQASTNDEPERDQGSEPENYANGFTNNEPVYVVMKFDIMAPSGEGFQPGDTLTFPFLQGRDVAVSNTAEENLIAGDGQTVLGTWKIADRNIVIVLNEAAAEKTSLNNCTITTAKTLRPYNQMVKSVVKTYTIGTTSHSYKMNELLRSPIGAPVAKSLSYATNHTIRWLVGLGSNLANDLTTSGGTSMQNVSSLIFEDEIPASESSTGISSFYITARVPFIMAENDMSAASAGGTMLLDANATASFSKIEQASTDDSYDTFKNRIKPFQYGVYEDGDGSYKFVINFGNPQATDYPLKYSDLFPDLKQSILDAGKGVSEAEAEAIARALGDGNAIGGNVVLWMFYLTTEYDQVFVDTQKTNTGVLSSVVDGNHTTNATSAQGILQAGSAVAFPTKSHATIEKTDSVTKAPLEGVVFKLQYTNDGGVTWNDASYDPVITGSNGQATTGTLATGTYRFVEVQGLDGYETEKLKCISSTGETNGTFTISSEDTKGVIVAATNTPKAYTINYNTDGGTTLPAKTNARYGDADLLPQDQPVKPGAVFTGWVVGDSGSEGSQNGQPATNDKKYSELADNADTMEITLKALYENREYTVQYDTNGGNPETLPPLDGVTWNDQDLLPSKNPTRPGYVFIGWQVSEGGVVGKVATNDSAYADLVQNDGVASIVLQAQWDPKEYVVCYDINGGNSGSIPDMTGVKWHDQGLLPSSDPTRENHVFTGWIVSEGGEGGQQANNTSAYRDLAWDDGTDIITLQAAWERKPVTNLIGLTVGNTVLGNLPNAETFTFEINLVSGNEAGVIIPQPAATDPMKTGSTTVTFGELSFTEVGTYVFEIKEIQGTTPLLTYDDSTITMTVIVTEDDVAFTVGEPVFTRGEESTDPVFVNVVLSEPDNPGEPDNSNEPDNPDNPNEPDNAGETREGPVEENTNSEGDTDNTFEGRIAVDQATDKSASNTSKDASDNERNNREDNNKNSRAMDGGKGLLKTGDAVALLMGLLGLCATAAGIIAFLFRKKKNI